MSSGGARRRRDNLSPALFPFLAVMVCTIGALVFILTIAVTQASQSAKAELQEVRDELQAKHDYVEVATEELLAQRADIQKKLDRARNSLAHLEDHIQRTIDEIEKIKSAIEKTASDEQLSSDAEEQKQKVAVLQEELEKLQTQLTEKIEERKTGRPAFSIIPYAGPNGTSRRPIYLECTAKGVILQPEGILLTLDDLKPPHGPGNPLDAALRKTRSELQKFEGSSQMASPYPLLLVRPDGIAAYALARSAMNAWDDQHGYELIEAELPLAFPESLPGLKEELDRTIADARRRQKDIFASLPKNVASSMDRAAQATDLAVEHGDDIPFGNGQVGQSVQGTFIPSNSATLVGSGFSPAYGGNDGTEDWPELEGGIEAPSFAGTDTMQSSATALRESQSNSGAGSGYGSPDATQGQPGDGTSANSGTTGNNGTEGEGAQANSQSVASGNAQQTSASPNSNAASGLRSPLAVGDSSGVVGASTPTATETGSLSEEISRAQERSQNDPEQPTAVVRPASNKKTSRTATSIANEAGEDWAVQQRRLSSTPMHRSISVRVMADRWLVVDSNSRTNLHREILLKEGPRNARKKLREAIEEEVNDWGAAVAGGYWVPIIKIYSEPGSEWATQQLTAMLEGSGAKIDLQK